MLIIGPKIKLHVLWQHRHNIKLHCIKLSELIIIDIQEEDYLLLYVLLTAYWLLEDATIWTMPVPKTDITMKICRQHIQPFNFDFS